MRGGAMTAVVFGAGFGIVIVLYIAVVVIEIVGVWMVFTKAGQPGWGSIVPVYNAYLYCKIAGRPGWWLFLFFIPVVNFVIAVILALDLAKAFGKSTGFAIGLVLLSFIFIPILGFGTSVYTQPLIVAQVKS
jgi:hypothetical protein